MRSPGSLIFEDAYFSVAVDRDNRGDELGPPDTLRGGRGILLALPLSGLIWAVLIYLLVY
jgi:hypothetical protein